MNQGNESRQGGVSRAVVGKRAQRPFRVAVLVGTDLHYDRQVLAGILDYARDKPNWHLLRSLGLPAIHRSFFSQIEADGFIAHSDPPEIPGPYLEKAKIVAIHQLEAEPSCDVHCVVNDDRETGRLVARHFLDRGYTSFGFKGIRNKAFSLSRQEGFVGELERSGHEAVSSLLLTRSYRHRRSAFFRVEKICDWLKTLPKPVAVMASHDLDALEVVEACNLLGLSIPHEVGIAGVDNDPFYTNTAAPPLTSVEQATHRIGYEAARRLDRLLSGEEVGRETEWIPPERLVVRASTEIQAVDDAVVSRAVGLIRAHPESIRTGEELARKVGISRSLLDRRFKASLGRTPFAEIQRNRLEAARSLLVNSRWSLTDIAYSCGFGDLKDFSIFFKRQTGLRPSHYRQQHGRRLGGD